MIDTTSYKIAKSLYVSFGGDINKEFESVDAVYDAIYELMNNSAGRINIEPIELSITENCTYEFNNQSVTGYKPVTIDVNIAQKYTDEQVIQLQTDARNEGYSEGETEGYKNGYTAGNTDGYTDGYTAGNTDGYTAGYTAGNTDGYTDGYTDGLDDGAEDQKALLESITISENGTYTKEDGYNEVIVEVDTPVFETESLSKTLTSNGTYDYVPTTDGYSDVHITVNVPTGGDTGRPKVYNGFRFTGGDMAKIDFSQYDWSGVYDTSNFFQNCSHSTGDWSNFEENYSGRVLSCSRMFQYCSKLTSIPQLDTSKVTDMSYMFDSCSKLTSIPQLDTSKVTNMNSMFAGCSSLTTIPQLDTSKVTNMNSMFSTCTSLTTIPLLDTSKATNMSSMFQYCSSLTTVPHLDTSNVNFTNSMFDRCSKLTSIPQLDTSKAIEMTYMFNACYSLTTVPLLDCSNVKRVDSMFQGASNINYLGGFKDLGKQTNVSGLNSYHFLYAISNLTYESIMNVINNLYDRASAGMSILTITLNSTTMGLLSDEDKAIATNKGWILS